MQMIQFVSILNLIQMKLMKVICMMKNMMKKEFQHFVESQLIEASFLKNSFDSEFYREKSHCTSLSIPLWNTSERIQKCLETLETDLLKVYCAGLFVHRNI
jgi:hypothetical protein